MRAKVIVMWWVTCAIWSTVWLAIKIGLRDLPPFTFAGLRLVLAVLLLVPVFVARPQVLRETRQHWRLIAGTGFLLLGVNYAFVFWGAQYISSGLTAVLQAATPAFGACFSYLLAREPIRRNEILGIIVGFLGLLMIFSDQLRAVNRESVWGALAIVCGTACVAFTYVLIARSGKHISPLSLTTGQMIAGSIPLLLAGAMVEGNPFDLRWTRTAVFALFYLAIAGSILGFWLNYWLLKRVGATSLLTISIVEPLFAVILGAIVLQESLSWRVAAGGIAVLVSASMILFKSTVRDREPATADA